MEKPDVFQIFRVFAAICRQRQRKNGSEYFGPLLAVCPLVSRVSHCLALEK